MWRKPQSDNGVLDEDIQKLGRWTSSQLSTFTSLHQLKRCMYNLNINFQTRRPVVSTLPSIDALASSKYQPTTILHHLGILFDGFSSYIRAQRRLEVGAFDLLKVSWSRDHLLSDKSKRLINPTSTKVLNKREGKVITSYA